MQHYNNLIIRARLDVYLFEQTAYRDGVVDVADIVGIDDAGMAAGVCVNFERHRDERILTVLSGDVLLEEDKRS